MQSSDRTQRSCKPHYSAARRIPLREQEATSPVENLIRRKAQECGMALLCPFELPNRSVRLVRQKLALIEQVQNDGLLILGGPNCQIHVRQCDLLRDGTRT